MINSPSFISVIICTHNRCEELKTALTSLLSQEGGEDVNYEVIAIDNNSSDDTRGVINNFMPRFAGRLRYIFEPKQGLSNARNRGISEAQGEITAFIDDDIVLDKAWLKSVSNACTTYNSACFGGKVVPVHDFKIPFWFDEKLLRLGGTVCAHNLGDVLFEYSDKTYEYGPCGANMFCRKTIFDKYGYFRTNLGRKGKQMLSGEETEFYFRLAKNKENVMYFPEAIVYHPIKRCQLKMHNILKRNFNNGKASVAIEGVGNKECVCYFKIPRYMIKKSLVLILDAVKEFIRMRYSKSFYYIIRLSNYFGQMHEIAIGGSEKKNE